jgi:hypothetical protein
MGGFTCGSRPDRRNDAAQRVTRSVPPDLDGPINRSDCACLLLPKPTAARIAGSQQAFGLSILGAVGLLIVAVDIGRMALSNSSLLD